MYYYLLKKYEHDKGLPVKVDSKIKKICGKMAKLAQQHAELDRKLVKEFALLNDISEDEASDIMSSYDFLVDYSQYGLGCIDFSQEEVTRIEYEKVKRGNK